MMRLDGLGQAEGIKQRIIGRVTELKDPIAEPRDAILLWKPESGAPPPNASRCQAVISSSAGLPGWAVKMPSVRGLTQLEYLRGGDVVVLAPGGFVRVLYRRASPNNFLLLAENCNSYCLMCSQPPRRVDDRAKVAEHLRTIDLIDPATRELGLTGGEPTLLKDDFLAIVERCNQRLPSTALHVLTNGRAFYYREFAERLGAIGHPDLMLGIPLYSDVDSEHDHVVQAQRAFEQTVFGLHHLARARVPVEVRIVVHRQTYERLPAVAEFIARNLPFAAQVALMGLEMTGLALAHPDALWIDPAAYQPQLLATAERLHCAGIPVRIYNLPLCLLDRGLWRFAVQSISDWKREYLPCCSNCSVREQCGGVFATSRGMQSRNIAPIVGGLDRPEVTPPMISTTKSPSPPYG
jgi:His-Xaa-Ser system radical SAM maturase HxsC